MIHHPVVLRRLEVASNHQISPGLHRVVLRGAQLGEFTNNGFVCAAFQSITFDDHVKVLPPGSGELRLPVQHDGHLHWPEDPPAVARDYTVRRFDAASGELTIDVVVDHDGPGAAWARSAAPGDAIHVAGPRTSGAYPPLTGSWVLVGDESALPAIGRFLEEREDATALELIAIVAPGATLGTALGLAGDPDVALDGVRVRRVERAVGDPEPHDRVAEALTSALAASGPDSFVWAACEFGTARRVRRVAAEHGVARSSMHVTHYWRRAAAHDELAASEQLRRQSDLYTPWALRVAASLDVADAIGDGATTAHAVAAATGAQPAGIRALLDYLVLAGVLTNDDGYALGATGELLRSDHPSGWRHRLARSTAERHLDASLAGLLVAVRDGVAGFPSLFGDDFWTTLGRSDELGASFDRDLGAWADVWAPAIAALPVWDAVGHVVDVGAGEGGLVGHLLAAWPAMQATVVEQVATVRRAEAALSGRGFVSRVRFAGQSFFDPLPAGGDAYVLAQVLHDWPDEQAVEILANCARAAGSDGQVIMIERLPLPDADPRDFLAMNLLMLSLFGATERRADDYRALAARAGLRVDAVHPTPTGLSLLIARPSG